MMEDRNLDLELVRKVQSGNKRAFDLLVIRYQHKVVSLINRFLHNYEESEDVAQETFIKAYKALANFRGDSAFYTWLYRIAVNSAKNHLASKKRRPPSSDIDSKDAEQIDINSGLKDIATPEHNLIRDEMQRTIIDSIANLSEDLRITISLRELEGMSYEEIAEIMSCPVGTVRSRIFRAREAIDVKLQPLLNN